MGNGGLKALIATYMLTYSKVPGKQTVQVLGKNQHKIEKMYFTHNNFINPKNSSYTRMFPLDYFWVPQLN